VPISKNGTSVFPFRNFRIYPAIIVNETQWILLDRFALLAYFLRKSAALWVSLAAHDTLEVTGSSPVSPIVGKTLADRVISHQSISPNKRY